MSTIKSFEELNKQELIAVGKMFGTDLPNAMNKPKMLEELSNDGVTIEEYLKQVGPPEEDADEPVELAALDDTPLEEEAPAPEVDEDDGYIVKMTRKNKTYQVRGYEFTQDHPYALVREEDADYLVESGGFRIAGPKEIREYYGRL